MSKFNRGAQRLRRHNRIRRRVLGSAERPRLAVFRSAKHIYVQAIDDAAGVTLAAASTAEKELKGGIKFGGNATAASKIGQQIAERLKAKGVTAAVFDRGGYRYHGRVQALADGAREGGLKF